MAATKLTNISGVPAGYADGVYGYTTNDFSCVGIKFPQTVNADRLLAVFVKMYVTDYTLTSGKEALLRIYNDTTNSILNEKTYTELGGKTGEWVYVNILELLQGSTGIISDGKLAPFSLLYRFYGATSGTVYFDSITVVSDGDPYGFDTPQLPDEGRAYETVRGVNCYQYSVSEFEGAAGTLSGGRSLFMEIDESCYSLKFSFTPSNFVGTLLIYGFTSESSPTSGIGVRLASTGAVITSGKGSVTIENDQTYEVEVGFVALNNGNTVYTFIKVNGTTVAWELVEAYGKTAGNIAIVSTSGKDSFVLA